MFSFPSPHPKVRPMTGLLVPIGRKSSGVTPKKCTSFIKDSSDLLLKQAKTRKGFSCSPYSKKPNKFKSIANTSASIHQDSNAILYS